MPGQLVEQLLGAGLVTETQARASDSQDSQMPSSQVVRNLVESGLDERALAGFFVSRGYGPMLQEQELLRADDELVRRLMGSDAHELCAIPLRESPAGTIVAMADPTDERAVARLSEALGGTILPTAAKLSDLLAAIDRAYPPERPTLVTDPMALLRARKRTPSGVVPLVQKSDTEQTVPIVDPSLSGLASTASPDWDRAWKRTTTERDVSLTPKASRIPLPVAFRPPFEQAASLRPEPSQPRSVSDSAIDAHLAEMSRVASRDDVVGVACRACLSAARASAFLALRKGVFRGWDGAGQDVTSAGIRSLWVPASNPSILNEVLHNGRPFRGAYGQTAADHLFRAALGSQGREVAIVPVMIGARMVGVLCANDPAQDTSAIERIADAMGQAFERLIVSQKSEG
jgi:GAF domain-containing protein